MTKTRKAKFPTRHNGKLYDIGEELPEDCNAPTMDDAPATLDASAPDVVITDQTLVDANQDLGKMVEELKDRNQSFEKRIDQQNQQLKDLAEEKQAALDLYSEANARITTLHGDLEKANQELEAANKELEIAKQALADASSTDVSSAEPEKPAAKKSAPKKAAKKS